MAVLSKTVLHGFPEFLLVSLGISRMPGLEGSLPGPFLRVVFREQPRGNVCFRDGEQVFLLLAIKAVDYAKSVSRSRKNLLII